jgi:hypothetical protein
MFRNLRSGFSIALVIFVIGLLLVHGWLPWPQSPSVRLSLAFLLVIFLGWFILRSSDIKAPTATALGKPIAEMPSAQDVALEYSSIIRNYSQATVRLFVEILTDPTHYLDRITEFVTIEADAPRLQLSAYQVFQLGHAHGEGEPGTTQDLPELLLIPIIWSQRGTLLDHLKVSADGEPVPTLSYNQTRGLMAYALEALLEKAELDEGKFWGHSAEWYEQQKKRLAKKLVLTICSPGPLHKQPRARQEKVESALSAIDVFPLTDDWRDRLKKFCRQYIDRYVIVVEVPARGAEHVGITYSHCIPLESPTNYPFNQWRERFGLSPSTIDIAQNAFFLQVEAYHLEIAAQPEQYVFDHHLEWIESRKRVVQEELRVDGFKPYVRLYHEEGRPNAHLYVRRQEVPSAEIRAADGALSRVKSVVQFREIPPGALGGATAVACASAAIITFFALTRLGLGGVGGHTPPVPSEPTDIPALLLVLPGFVTVVLGSWIELSRLRRASLTTYLALAGTMLFSLISALYYLYGTGRDTPGEFTLTTIDKHVHISTDIGWLILMVITVTHALFLVRQVISESRYYFRCVRGRVLGASLIDKNTL